MKGLTLFIFFRLMFSDGGLLFVTYDRYATFYEIGMEDL